ncbi:MULTISPECIES: FAD-dependent oxidoreductase [unclassified Brevundimonas]|uniref:FAD-dependent oxidoreductase n=1 Tax=unclassified Brevundimonas TaxID=2622653 RepID=UPI0025C313B1|nr:MULTISPECIES: FAD-dependent oxidoreductase [unclassified Brevundimonas]
MTDTTASSDVWDLIIIGGGTAGLSTAIFASARAPRVLLLDTAEALGGTLWVANGQLSAAGTRLQKERGIEDSPQDHFDDIMRLSRGTVNEELVRLAVWNAADTFDWLMDQGFDVDPACPVDGVGHEPYSRARYYWGLQGGASVRKVLVGAVEKAVSEGRLQVRLQHRATRLLTDDTGAVIGVEATDARGTIHCFRSLNTVLACGGYTANPEMYAALNGRPLYTNLPYRHSQGDGYTLGQSVGGVLRGQENFFCNFGFLLDGEQPKPGMVGRLNTYPQKRLPWEIYVNVHGNRFVREDMESVDARENALLEQPDQRYWAIFDQTILETAPPLVAGFDNEGFAALFEQGRPFFYKADTLEELAQKAGVGTDGLLSAVRGYNFGVASGNDFFGRRHLPAPIANGPFYAIRVQGAAVSSAVGLSVDNKLRVIRAGGQPVSGLWAAGEIIGASQTMGRAVCGGMMATPALTFGRLLGQKLIALGDPQ